MSESEMGFERTADDCDRAAQNQEFEVRTAVMNARSSLNHGPKLPAKGSCWNCGEPLPHPQLFCDEDCSHDYERLKAQGKL